MNLNIYKVTFLLYQLLVFLNLFVAYLFRQRDCKISFYRRSACDYFLFHPAGGQETNNFLRLTIDQVTIIQQILRKVSFDIRDEFHHQLSLMQPVTLLKITSTMDVFAELLQNAIESKGNLLCSLIESRFLQNLPFAKICS